MFKNLIAGEWLDGAAVSRNINPSDTSDVIGLYAQADEAQALNAIAAARAAFPAWAFATPQQRFDILDAVGTDGVYLTLENASEEEFAEAGRVVDRYRPKRSGTGSVA